jgi:hypothetical protein
LRPDQQAGVYRASRPSSDESREATRSQYWMLAVMVAFASLGLWLLLDQ